MIMGRCNNFFSSVQFSSVQFSSARLGSAWQGYNALFSVYQVIFSNFRKKIIAGDRDICALPPAFCAAKGGDKGG